MINDNKRYDLDEYNRNLKKGTEKSKNQLLMLRRTFVILLSTSLFLGLILIGGILGKAARGDGKTPIFELRNTDPTPPSTTIGTIASPTPTVPFVITEQLPADPLSDAYWGELVPAENPIPYEHFDVHGLYLNKVVNLEQCIDLANNSEINAFVIDLKEAEGVYYNTSNETAAQIGYLYNYYNLEEVCQTCHDNDIYVIGRIVCFKDPRLASTYPDRAICDSTGNPLFFSTEGSEAFANPYDQRNWDYLIELAEEAISMGVDEIQFDYVRFPTGSTTTGNAPYFGPDDQVPSKSAAINRFLQTARIRIQDTLGIPVTADIFGIAVTSSLDGDLLGQDWATVGFTGVDALCPMIYPSHYALGTQMNGMTFDAPDLYPYDIMLNALLIGSQYHDQPGYSTVRPYLQAFTASYIGEGNYMEYDYEAINDQIRALQDAGLDEWILWNAAVEYPEGNYGGNNG